MDAGAWRTVGWILVAQACGGSAPALTKLALDGLGPWSVVVARQLLGTLFLAAALAVRTRGAPPPLPLTRRDWLLLCVLAWAGFALPQVLTAVGLDLSTATHGALLIPLEPIGIFIGGALFLREPMTQARALAILLGVGGAVLIVLPSGGSFVGGSVRGDVLMALGHLSWAIYTLAAKPLLARHDPLRIAVLASALSALPLLPLAAAEPLDAERAIGALGWIVVLAFVVTTLGTFSWNRALRAVPAGTLAATIFIQPIVGLAIGVLALGEPAGIRELFGAALIAIGVALATWPRRIGWGRWLRS